jgi:hypothetical protein
MHRGGLHDGGKRNLPSRARVRGRGEGSRHPFFRDPHPVRPGFDVPVFGSHLGAAMAQPTGLLSICYRDELELSELLRDYVEFRRQLQNIGTMATDAGIGETWRARLDGCLVPRKSGPQFRKLRISAPGRRAASELLCRRRFWPERRQFRRSASNS